MAEVSLATELHWTEKQIFEDNSAEFLEKMKIYMSAQAEAQKAEELKHKLSAKSKTSH